MDIHEIILAAKLGRERKYAQVDTCTVFAAALYDLLTDRGVPCRMVTAVKRGFGTWAHAVVEVDGCYYDSMGEFTTEIYRARAKVHPDVTVEIEYQPDFREECYEPEYDELHAFFIKVIGKTMDKAVQHAVPSQKRSRDHLVSRDRSVSM